jgi:hypothetical protein
MSTVDGVEITDPMAERFHEVLTPRALRLIGLLHRELNGRRLERLQARQERVQALADGGTLDFLPETAHVRGDDSWRVADPAPGLVDRRVEMTGPTDRKMTISALNSGAKCWSSGSSRRRWARSVTPAGMPSPPADGTMHASCSPRWRSRTPTPTSSPSRPTSACPDRTSGV